MDNITPITNYPKTTNVKYGKDSLYIFFFSKI